MPLEKDILALLPRLTGFARVLSGSRDAEDLVQDTFVKAWVHRANYQEGSNLYAWLATILRNTYLSQLRKHIREVEDVDGVFAAHAMTPPNQEHYVRIQELAAAWDELPFEQQESLMLVGVEGLDYDTAAHILGVKVGTVKSRANRARLALSTRIDEELPKNIMEKAWEKFQKMDIETDENVQRVLSEDDWRDP